MAGVWPLYTGFQQLVCLQLSQLLNFLSICSGLTPNKKQKDDIAKETNLVQAADMKFLAVINPLENNLIHASVKYATDESGAINIVASLFKDELVHFKCKAKLQVPGH